MERREYIKKTVGEYGIFILLGVVAALGIIAMVLVAFDINHEFYQREERMKNNLNMCLDFGYSWVDAIETLPGPDSEPYKSVVTCCRNEFTGDGTEWLGTSCRKIMEFSQSSNIEVGGY